MKIKTLLLVILCTAFSTASFSQTYKYHATSFAIKDLTYYKSEWSDWKECYIPMVFNFDKSKLTIYSNTTQDFDLLNVAETYYDKNGNKTYLIKAIDKDGKRCDIRQVFITNPKTIVSQVYIDYLDVSYVYNLEKD